MFVVVAAGVAAAVVDVVVVVVFVDVCVCICVVRAFCRRWLFVVSLLSAVFLSACFGGGPLVIIVCCL